MSYSFNWARAKGTKKLDTVQPMSGIEPSYLRGQMMTNENIRLFQKTMRFGVVTCLKQPRIFQVFSCENSEIFRTAVFAIGTLTVKSSQIPACYSS